VSTAAALGRAAGRQFLSPSLNPFKDGTAQSVEWDRAWRLATAEELAERDAQRRRHGGYIAAEACTSVDEISYPGMRFGT
jgi:hypothetical protein